MKYFTPELLARFGSEDNQVADAAQEEWEQVHQEYMRHLEVIRPQLPASVQTLLDRFCLHDAKVLMIGRDHPLFTIVLQPESGPDEAIQIIYRLAGSPKYLRHVALADDAPLEWLYDEFDVRQEGDILLFSHTILFTGGQELRLQFYDLQWMLYRKILSPVRHQQAEQTELVDLEALLT